MRITEANLTEKQRVELEYTLHFDTREFMQKRCRIVLYKAEGLSSKKISEMLSTSEHRINRWVKRYLENGIDGMRNKSGQRAKLIMGPSDEQPVREASPTTG